MNHQLEEPRPVKVEVVAAAAGKTPRPRYTAKYETFVLTANDPVQCILPADDDRVIAHVQTLDNDVVIASSKAVAANPLNTISSTPTPQGCLIPAKTTGGSAPLYPVLDNEAVYAGATTTSSNSRVAVAAVYRSPR